jgi:hypothetical protein
MTPDSGIKGAVWFFVIIVVGALLSAVLGGLFGALVAVISPEFVRSLFGSEAGKALMRYSLSVGMIWGLFLGVGVAGFACFLATVIRILRIRFEYRRDAGGQPTEGGPP